MNRLETFEANRRRLFGLAYRLLGEASEAEDIVQDAYLRWERSDAPDSPEAWLTKVVTNLCLNRLTSARAQRERYVGTWLPEPVSTADGALGPLETVEQRDSLSLGMLVLLERLTAAERATFVLREAFSHSHRQIADILELDEAHVRQLYRRARQHTAVARKRFDTTPEQRHELVERFLAATLAGNVEDLEQLLAEDVVAWADGGGKAPATRLPVVGRIKVVRYLAAMTTHPLWGSVTSAAVAIVNGEPAIAIEQEGRLAVIVVPELDGDRVVALRTVTNPDKLAFLAGQN